MTATKLRRRPARRVFGTVAALLLALIGTLGAITAIVRLATGTLPGSAATVAGWLADRRWDEPIALVVFGALAVAGALFVAAAIKPGQPGVLALQPPRPPRQPTELVMSRRALARWLAWRIELVDGVDAVRVQVAERRIRIRVQTVTRYTEDIREQVRAVATETVGGAGFNRTPRVQVSARHRP